MQMQFHKNPLSCLQQIKDQVLTQEQTLELRLEEDKPDVGSILGSWGQVLVRGKQWHSGTMELSCGVMVWTMYQPEDGSAPQMVEGWLPFSFKWELPPTDRDGRMCVTTCLRSVDARVVSAKKLMLRASVSVLGEAWIGSQIEIPGVPDLPEDVCLLKQTYPLMLLREAGEKAFTLEEELKLPEAAPAMEQLLQSSLQPELIDRKVMGDKVVFRGVCLLHILYRDVDGGICTWDFELPFSQFSDLEREYGPDARASIVIETTSLEAEPTENRKIHLRAGLTGQYLISDRTQAELVEDAYSPRRTITTQANVLSVPAVLEEQTQTIHAEQIFQEPCSRVVRVTFFPDQPQAARDPGGAQTDLCAQFNILYYDHEQNLRSASAKWSNPWSLGADPNVRVRLTAQPTGTPQALLGAQTTAQADLLLDVRTTLDQEIPVICGLEIGEMTQSDPQRPSLILRRAGHDTLWQIAKSTGSTEEAISKANGLQGPPDPSQMLLIPLI